MYVVLHDHKLGIHDTYKRIHTPKKKNVVKIAYLGSKIVPEQKKNFQSTLPCMLMVNLFSSGAPHIHILTKFCNNSACCLVC